MGRGILGTGEDTPERAAALVQAGVDVLVLDTAHGHSKKVIEMLRYLKSEFGQNVDIVAGNVGTGEGTQALIEEGAERRQSRLRPRGDFCTNPASSPESVCPK